LKYFYYLYYHLPNPPKYRNIEDLKNDAMKIVKAIIELEKISNETKLFIELLESFNIYEQFLLAKELKVSERVLPKTEKMDKFTVKLTLEKG